jgi:hypothetical protein
MEIDLDSMIHFIDVPVVRRRSALVTKIYGKRNHNGCYLITGSNHPPHDKRIIQSLHSRATIFQGGKYQFNEIDNLRLDLQCNGYPQWSLSHFLIRR